MRIAGGILLILIGCWSLVGGGCSVAGGAAVGKLSSGASDLSKELKAAGVSGGDKTLAKAMGDAESAGTGLMVSGVVILLGGLLSLVAGILMLTNKAKIFDLVAPGVGIIGEILFFAMVAFNIAGVIKILILAFCAIAATKVGAEATGHSAAGKPALAAR
jgi:hypothetical protein